MPFLQFAIIQNARKPLIEPRRAILKNRSNPGTKLTFRMLLLAFPNTPRGDVPNVFSTASRAGNTLRPTQRNEKIVRNVQISKVLDGFHQGAGVISHSGILSLWLKDASPRAY
jgi:hypothetical protein